MDTHAQPDPEQLNPLIHLYNQGKYAQVLAAFTERYEVIGASFEANRLYAATLFKLGKWHEAAIYADKARALRPDDFAIHALLFDLHKETRDKPQAKQSLKKLISLNPEDSETIFKTFQYHKMCRNLEAGRRSLRKLHAVKAKDIDVLRVCALVEPSLLSNEDLSFLREMEVNGSLNDRIKAAFSLGQFHLSRKEFSNARPHFDRANADTLKTVAVKERFSRIVDLWRFSPFEKDFFEIRVRPKNRSRDVLVLGASRSGKSLLETALCELCGAQALGEDKTLSDFVESCPGREKGKIWKYLSDSSDVTIRKDAEKLDQKLTAISEDLKVHTLPGNIFHLPLLSLWKREMPIIFMKRRLYDHAISIYLKKFKEPHELLCTLEGAVRYVYLYNKLVMHFSRVLPNPMALVSYDGLVQNPGRMARQVVGFVGEDVLDWERFEAALLSEAADDPPFLLPGGIDASTRVTSEFRQLELAFPDYKVAVNRAVEKLREEGADMRLLDLGNDDKAVSHRGA